MKTYLVMLACLALVDCSRPRPLSEPTQPSAQDELEAVEDVLKKATKLSEEPNQKTATMAKGPPPRYSGCRVSCDNGEERIERDLPAGDCEKRLREVKCVLTPMWSFPKATD